MALAGCGGSTSSDEPVRNNKNPVTMAQKYTMDGTVDFSAFTTVNSQALTINDNLGKEGGKAVQTTELYWAMDNDDRNLYIALKWQDLTQNNGYDLNSGPTDYDGIRVLFDVDGNGTFDEGEDLRTLIAASIGSLYTDQHKVASGEAADLIGDGYGKLRYDAATQTYQAELLLPMSQDAKGQDGVLTSKSKINFVIYDHVTATTGNVGYAFGSSSSSGAWPSLPLKSEVGFSHPALPGGLSGLVAFIGEQDAPVGEIYTMNPATGAVRRVTVNTNLYKDNISLSHDRTRIAFEGVLCDFNSETIGQCRQRTADYEIYRVDADGRNFTQLTANATRDAHPGWAVDDRRLVYTSYRNSGKGAVVLMDVDGVETADLSGAGDDRDPDFLPDGRIVFATNRFTTSYKTRIAVMSAAGTDVVQLTSMDGVSDQAPVGDASRAVFERFSMDADPATVVESLFAPWNLVGVQLTGVSESTLLSDGWVNRHPVIDPSGKYVAYLKNTGYSAAHLMGRAGNQYGRFIPDITSIRSLDWK
jgi:Tol biopolymer transport system component